MQVEEPWDPGDGGPHSREFITTTDLYVAGDYAYMGSINHVLHIVDISRPAAMRLIASLTGPTTMAACAFSIWPTPCIRWK